MTVSTTIDRQTTGWTVAQEPVRLLINGDWRDAAGGATYEVSNPTTGMALINVPSATSADVDAAVAAARSAFDSGVWRDLPAAERQDGLHRCATALRAHAQMLAKVMSEEGGKPLREGLAEVEQMASYFQYAAAACRQLSGQAMTAETASALAFTSHVPLGVIAAVTPYNFPLWTFGAKVAMALAAGCSVVLKPAPNTPISALRAAEIVVACGVPDGVLNVVTTDEVSVSAHLTNHPDVDGVSFTGSTAVGAEIMRAAAGSFKRLTLELGGKSPNIVFADADLDAFEEGFFASIFLNSGQVCVAGSLLLIQRDVLDQVLQRVVRVARNVVPGNPWEAGTVYGPLISQVHRERVHGFVRRAQADGAEVLAGGAAMDGPGFFYEPTVLLAKDPGIEACREEIFGPVVTVLPFDDEADALRLANGTGFGLKAACWTGDTGRMLRMVRDLRAGSVIGNAFRPPAPQAPMPFGGFGKSGFGRELGLEGMLRAFTETKSVMVSLS